MTQHVTNDAERLEPEQIRPRFPGLTRLFDGQPASFLDGPAGTQVPESVIEAMASYLRLSNSNLGGAFATSQETEALVSRARAAAADLVGGEPDCIVLGPSMTTLNFLLAHAVARTLEPGDEIVTTTLDHDANISPWLLVAADHDLVVRQVGLTADLNVDLDDLRANLTDRTRVVAYTLASNAVGTLTPSAEIASLAHEVGALAWADAVHYAAHRRVDVAALGCDVLICSAYKFFGPHVALCWARRDLLAGLPADKVRPAEETPPGHRFETGTPVLEGLAGLIAAIDYLRSLGTGDGARAELDSAFGRIRGHEELLARRFLEGARAIPGLTVLGIDDPERVGERVSTFAVTAAGLAPSELAARLAARRIFTWDGNYYALALMEHLGLEGAGGALRIGLLHYTTTGEVDGVLEALSDCLNAASGG